MPITLTNAASSINDFLLEADNCVDSDCGFASMLCVFAVIEAVSEAIAGRSLDTLNLFSIFIKEMDDSSTWLIPPATMTPTSEYLAGILAETRHGLVHQLSLPSDIILVDSLLNASKLVQANREWCILGIYEFVKAVSRTTNSIIQAYPDAVLDPSPRGRERGTAQTYVVEESD